MQIVDKDLSEQQAFELEEFVISLIKIKNQGGTLTNMTHGGEGVSGYKFTEDVKERISLATAGLKNGNSDKNMYSFVNFYTKEEIHSTRQDFTKETGVFVGDLFKGYVLTTKSWCLKENLHKIKLPKCDCRLWNFVHVDGRNIVATRRDFKKQTGHDPKCLFKAGKYKLKSSKGWSLAPQQTELQPPHFP